MPLSLFKRQFVQFADQPSQQLIESGRAAVMVYPTHEDDGRDSACDNEPRLWTAPFVMRGGAAHNGVARMRIASIFVFMPSYILGSLES